MALEFTCRRYYHLILRQVDVLLKFEENVDLFYNIRCYRQECKKNRSIEQSRFK